MEPILILGFILYVGSLWGAKYLEVAQVRRLNPEGLASLKPVLNTWRILTMAPFPFLVLGLFLTNNGLKVFSMVLGFIVLAVVWGTGLTLTLDSKLKRLDLEAGIRSALVQSFIIRYAGELSLLGALGWWIIRNVSDGLP